MVSGINDRKKIDVGQAHTLWRLLMNRYTFAGHLQQLKNFTHDKDFYIYLDRIISNWKKEENILEKELER